MKGTAIYFDASKHHMNEGIERKEGEISGQ